MDTWIGQDKRKRAHLSNTSAQVCSEPVLGTSAPVAEQKHRQERDGPILKGTPVEAQSKRLSPPWIRGVMVGRSRAARQTRFGREARPNFGERADADC